MLCPYSPAWHAVTGSMPLGMDEMLVHCRVTPSIEMCHHVTIIAIYSWVEWDSVRQTLYWAAQERMQHSEKLAWTEQRQLDMELCPLTIGPPSLISPRSSLVTHRKCNTYLIQKHQKTGKNESLNALLTKCHNIPGLIMSCTQPKKNSL